MIYATMTSLRVVCLGFIIRLVKSGKFLDPVSTDFIFRAPALGCPFGSSVA